MLFLIAIWTIYLSVVKCNDSEFLNRVFDATLLQKHQGFDNFDYHTDIVGKHHYLSCSLQSKEKNSFQIATDILGADFVNIANVDHQKNEICFFIFANHPEKNSLIKRNIELEEIPTLLKIHESVFTFTEDFLLTSSQDLHENSQDFIHTNIDLIKSAPSKLLSVFFAPFMSSMPQIVDTVQKIISEWSSSHNLQHIRRMHNSKGWNELSQKLRNKFANQVLDASCFLPPTTTFRYTDNTLKLEDLSGWTRDATSHMCFLSLVEAFANHTGVFTVSIQERPVLLNYDARGSSQSGLATHTPYTDAGITGEGQIVGVADSGLNDLSCFFYDNSEAYSTPSTTRTAANTYTVEASRRKVIKYVSYADGADTFAGHGTHVTGTIVGNSIFGKYSAGNGVAPGAKVAFFDIQGGSSAYLNVPSLSSNVFKTLYMTGARVLSNSWGSSVSGAYDDRCFDVDYFTNLNQDVLVIFAAGNSGNDGKSSVFSPCTSKNVLCVGSVDLRDDITDEDIFSTSSSRVSYFSSMGPTRDGRFKPEIVAPGYKIVSAMSGGSNVDKNCGVYESFGTSMATPVVAGGALLIREYFSSHWPSLCRATYAMCKSFVPSGYMLKAVIMHSGQAVSSYSSVGFDPKTDINSFKLSNTPDFVQGYGEMTMTNVLPLAGSHMDLFVSDFTANAYITYELIVTVKSSDFPLKVTLAWYDAPSNAGSTSKLLIRNLDLVVTNEDVTNLWYGNGNGRDTLHPQEQVFIEKPEIGIYRIRVINTIYSSIKAAIVITCDGEISSELVAQSEHETLPVQNIFRAYDDIRNNQLLRESVATTATGTNQLREENQDTADLDVRTPQRRLSESYRDERFVVRHTLNPLELITVGGFSVNEFEGLNSVSIELDATVSGGSASFIFAVLLKSPSGETFQFGGYQNYAATDRLWQRMWPVMWTSSSLPPDGSTKWTATRMVPIIPDQTDQIGDWEVAISLFYDSWPSTVYSGTVSVSIKKTKADDASENIEAVFKDMSNSNVAIISVFAVVAGLLIVLVAIRYSRAKLMNENSASGTENAVDRIGLVDSPSSSSTSIQISSKSSPSGMVLRDMVSLRTPQFVKSKYQKIDENAESKNELVSDVANSL